MKFSFLIHYIDCNSLQSQQVLGRWCSKWLLQFSCWILVIHLYTLKISALVFDKQSLYGSKLREMLTINWLLPLKHLAAPVQWYVCHGLWISSFISSTCHGATYLTLAAFKKQWNVFQIHSFSLCYYLYSSYLACMVEIARKPRLFLILVLYATRPFSLKEIMLLIQFITFNISIYISYCIRSDMVACHSSSLTIHYILVLLYYGLFKPIGPHVWPMLSKLKYLLTVFTVVFIRLCYFS